MILAGDIGGTKTVLALYPDDSTSAPGYIHYHRYESARYPSLAPLISHFLTTTQAQPSAACLGVAGPVRNQCARITNLPWQISAGEIQQLCAISRVDLLNDVEALAVAVPSLPADDLHTLNRGLPEPTGPRLIIAPGTGLGIAFSIWENDHYRACASEGGHCAFSPRTGQERALLAFLEEQHGHVSFERVCSGSQLPALYAFLRDKEFLPEPDWLQTALASADDTTAVIVQTALEGKAAICEKTLDIFIHALATFIGNMAVTLLPSGGIYLGGGIPPRILERLKHPDFLTGISDKGRFRSLCDSLPIHVILSPDAALQGAASYARQHLGR